MTYSPTFSSLPQPSSSSRMLGSWLVALGLLLGCASGCAAGPVAPPVEPLPPVTEVERVPPRVESFPKVIYRNDPAYLVIDRWYYRHHGRWYLFQREPAELQRLRAAYRPDQGPHRNAYGYNRDIALSAVR